jgi:hypothetical protein
MEKPSALFFYKKFERKIFCGRTVVLIGECELLYRI